MFDDILEHSRMVNRRSRNKDEQDAKDEEKGHRNRDEQDARDEEMEKKSDK
jgi:hypothetical protein